MELTSRLALGLQVALTGPHLLAIVAGGLLGLWVGRSGGRLSVPAVIALLLPLVPAIDTASVLMLIVAVQGGAAVGEAALSDGVLGDAALGDAAVGARRALLFAAVLGAWLSCLGIALLVPLLTELGFHFGPAESFSLMLLCLVLACALAAGSLLASLAMALLGLLLTQIGHDPVFGTPRFLVELPQLARGVSVAPLAIGLFAGADILAGLDRRPLKHGALAAARDGASRTVSERWAAALRSTVRGSGIGLALGLLPGRAPRLARACAIASERRLEPAAGGDDGAPAGTGAAAAAQAATLIGIVPLLALGLPTNGVFALVAAALSLKGLQAGPLVMTSRPDLFWGAIAAMALAAGMLLVLVSVAMRWWPRRATGEGIRAGLALPALLVAALGVSLTSATPVLDMAVLALATVFAYLLRKLDCQIEPLLLGFVLGPAMEDSLRRALQRTGGDWAVFVDRPLSAGLLAMAMMTMLAATPPLVRHWRERTFGRAA